LMAALWASGGGGRVTLLEQNDRPGKKLLVTGNGKCNMTNTDQSMRHYHGSDPLFAEVVLQRFTSCQTIRFFTELGVFTKNRNGWIYPYCEQAQAVLKLLTEEAHRRKVRIKTREHVTEIDRTGDGFTVHTEGWKYPADRVILCGGGPASAVQGSATDCMELAARLGHRIIPPLPALVPLRGTGNAYGRWAGVRMDGAVTLYIDGREIQREAGEIQFTEYGVSGIPVFQVSIAAVRAAHEGRRVLLTLDLMPEFTIDELADFLAGRADSRSGQTDPELFVGLLPDKMIRMMTEKVHREPKEYAGLLKAYPVPVQGAHSMERAQVCSGGVALSEVDPTTMESRLLPGLYFAGEILDICGDCGGYNLQWAWSTGALAGKSAAQP
ncbi:MAG TPA: aminoacetone oxidase family FAD-binding enzyme, partial [Lachnospiraceae bacterium]|nr:aminoacetone oxidase family FAD-binding enzyme [Lachnospiraceae bacterium]